MSVLTVSNVTHGFGARQILDDASFRLLKGEHVGLIGANGEGKSTFMNIITNKLMPDEGNIEWSKNVRVGYLDQHSILEKGMTIRDVLKSAFNFLFELEAKMNNICNELADASEEKMAELMEEFGTIQDLLDAHDFYIIDSKVEEIGRALGLTDIGLDKDVTDLSGGQRTKVLLGKLLLEKPDILLLDEPTNYLDVEHIEWLKRYLAQLESAYKKQQQEINELQDFVARNKARVSTRNMAMSRQKKLDKMDVIELAKEKPKPEFHFKEARAASRYIFQTEHLIIGYEEPLSKPISISMERGDKIVLKGANGIGKTTLMKSILGIIPPLNGKVTLGDYLYQGYFEQEMTGAKNNTCIEELWCEFPSWTQYEVRSALAKCGLTTKHIESQVRVLSGGEQAKVRLCKLINRETNILLLDEPTNHLDVEAKEELKRALSEYKGSILLICHEPDFYEDFATKVIDCSNWSTKI